MFFVWFLQHEGKRDPPRVKSTCTCNIEMIELILNGSTVFKYNRLVGFFDLII